MANITVGYLTDRTPCDYTTLESAASAMAEGDTLQLYYGQASGIDRELFDITSSAGNLTVKGSLIGMLDNMQCLLRVTYTYHGILVQSTTTNQITIKNFRLLFNATKGDGYYFNAILKAVARNADILIENVYNLSQRYLGIDDYGTYTQTITMRNVVSIGGLSHRRVSSDIQFCSLIEFYNNDSYYLSTHKTRNTFSKSFTLGGNGVWDPATGNNASEDSSAPGSSSLHGVDADTAKFLKDHSDKYNLFDFRVVDSSSFVGAGVAISGITTDIDGQTRADPPAIGASEGVPAYGLESTDPGESNVLAPITYKINGVDKTGTYSPDFPDAGNVIEGDTVNGSPGTYHEATTAEVQLGVTFGPSQTYTGTLIPSGGTATTPTNPTITDSGDGVNWTLAATADSGDTVIVTDAAGDAVAAFAADDGSINVNNLTAGGNYTFKAVHDNKYDSADTATVTAPSLATPAAAEPGTISIDGYNGTTMYLRYTPGDNVDTAILYLTRYDTGLTTTVSVTSGQNNVTVVQGKIYRLVVAAYNAAGTLGGFTNAIFVSVPSTGEGNDLTIRWKSDYDIDWQSVGLNADDTRARIPTNRLGHHFQWEVQQHKQNERLVIRNVAMTARMGGRAYGAQQ